MKTTLNCVELNYCILYIFYIWGLPTFTEYVTFTFNLVRCSTVKTPCMSSERTKVNHPLSV